MQLKDIKLTYKARQMIEIGEKIGGHYELEKAAYDGNLKVLATLISILSDNLTFNDALDVIDETIDAGITIKQAYEEIFKGMNEKAFFTERLEVLEIPPVNMEKMTQDMVQQAQEKMGQKAIEQAITENTSKPLRK